LFDLVNDPGEQRDIARAHPKIVARLKAAFDAMNRELSAKSKSE
jgi:hypothetical protein